MNKSDKYHHGDLRNLLIAESLEMLQSSGLDKFSMRKLAERAGVSRTAPYHHFKDKNDLLAAIAEQGFELMSQELAMVLSMNESFEQTVSTYIDFALNNPVQYDLMFGRESWRASPSVKLQRTAKDCFREYAKLIAVFQEKGLLLAQDDPLRMAQVLWSTLHGLVKLAHDGIFIRPEDLHEMARYALSRFRRDKV